MSVFLIHQREEKKKRERQAKKKGLTIYNFLKSEDWNETLPPTFSHAHISYDCYHFEADIDS